MSGITVLSGNQILESTIVELFGKTTPVRRVWSDQWRDPADVAMDACAADPELVIIGSDVLADEVLLVLGEIDRRFPATTVVCLVNHQDTDVSMTLLRQGARDVVVESGPTNTFRNQLGPVLHVAQIRHQRATEAADTNLRRRVITVISPKGGTGKTTVSTNLAVALAKQRSKQVVLLDLDAQFGDCAAALSIEPEYSLADAVKGISHERSTVKVFLGSHPSGLAVLAPPDDLVAAEEIETDGLKRTLATFAEEFPYVVIDTASGIDSFTLAAMEQATDLLLVSTTDVPAIRALRRQLEALDQIGYTSQRRTFVLNRANAKVGLSVSEIEAAVGMPALFRLPSTRMIPVSTNEGVAIVDRDSGGNVARKFEELARYFAPDAGGGRGRFKGRKDR